MGVSVVRGTNVTTRTSIVGVGVEEGVSVGIRAVFPGRPCLESPAKRPDRVAGKVSHRFFTKTGYYPQAVLAWIAGEAAGGSSRATSRQSVSDASPDVPLESRRSPCFPITA